VWQNCDPQSQIKIL